MLDEKTMKNKLQFHFKIIFDNSARENEKY